MSPPEAAFLNTILTVVPWPDPVVEAIGHDPRSPYVERFWLPVLGPSTVWLLRRMAGRLEAEPEGFSLNLPDTAMELGLADKTGRSGPFVRSLVRTVQFGAAQTFGESLAVRRKLPYVPERHVHRFPQSLRRAHEECLRDEEDNSTEQQRRRVFGLALTLLRLGETSDDVTWQLRQWRFGPALTEEAVQWGLHRSTPADAA